MISYVSTEKFDFDKRGRVFSQEISALPEGFNPMGQIYPDSCDGGFILVSPRSGVEIRMAHTATDRCGEDIAGWWFSPVKKDAGICPGIRVLIIND